MIEKLTKEHLEELVKRTQAQAEANTVFQFTDFSDMRITFAEASDGCLDCSIQRLDVNRFLTMSLTIEAERQLLEALQKREKERNSLT